MRCSSSTTRWCSAWSCRPTVNAAINRKIEQYYLVQEYAFRVEREKKESERKQIEANGIRDFQQTVTQGISDSYVRWRGIEATLQLAQSPNTKIVIIGSGKDGLPVILGNVDTPMQPNPAAPAAPPGARAARQQRSGPPTAGRPRARRSWKRRRPAICRARRTAVADRGAARARTPRSTPPGGAAEQPAPAQRQVKPSAGAPAESRAHLGPGPRFQDLISRTVGAGDAGTGRSSAAANARTGRARGRTRSGPAAASRSEPAAASGGGAAARPGRTAGPPRPPEQPAIISPVGL